MYDDDKIPVTIVAGFLGTGKTTFIKRLCTELHNIKIAILQNEFSDEMGIERPLLLNAGADVYELPNGCICCSSKDGLVVALESVLKLRARFDWIIIEASGIADPVDLAGNFWLDYNLDSPIQLDGVITITDVNILEEIFNAVVADEPSFKVSNLAVDGSSFKVELAIKQLSVADVIIVNRCDLKSLTDSIREKLIDYFNCVKVIETVHCNVVLDDVMNLNMFNSSKILNFNPKIHKHNDNSLLKPLFIKTGCIYSLKFLNDFISTLLWEDQNCNIYRCKGIFKAFKDCKMIDEVNNQIGIYQLQGVGMLFEITCTNVSQIEDNKFLFIGTNLNEAFIQRQLNYN